MQPPKEHRRPVKLPATIHRGDGQSPVPCTVMEISEHRARLSVPDADFIPVEFTLTFAGGTQVQRQCIVLSREKGQITVMITKIN
jgi:hypothetical protein